MVSPKKLNAYLMLNLPSAYLAGVRVKYINHNECQVKVRHKWINQNPFKSMFWAVQGMAAELSTGTLVMQKIKQTGKQISMLVAQNNATFTKKATGKITFLCTDGAVVDDAIFKAINNGEGQTFWMTAVGKNEDGIEVSTFNFEWTIKVKG